MSVEVEQDEGCLPHVSFDVVLVSNAEHRHWKGALRYCLGYGYSQVEAIELADRWRVALRNIDGPSSTPEALNPDEHTGDFYRAAWKRVVANYGLDIDALLVAARDAEARQSALRNIDGPLVEISQHWCIVHDDWADDLSLIDGKCLDGDDDETCQLRPLFFRDIKDGSEYPETHTIGGTPASEINVGLQ